MVRASKKDESSKQPSEEEEKRRRLKKLLFSRNLLSQAPSKPNSPLAPSKLVVKHDGRDIVKKSQRKNRFLFSFPGLMAPISGGKIGELKDLETENPILYLDFPQGQMKLFGTIVYPKNRYLTLQFSRGGKNVTCDDYFDTMIVFADAWWIGRKSENPEEIRLEFPKDLNGERHGEYDFKGGAGATCEEKPGPNKPGKEYAEPHSPIVNIEDDDASEDSGPLTGKTSKNLMELTPVRHSARTAGKKFNFAEDASGDDSVESDDNITEVTKKRVTERNDRAASNSTLETNGNSSFEDTAQGDVNAADVTDLLGNNLPSSVSAKKLKESSPHKRLPLVQATIATLFEKVEEKKSSGSVKRSLPKVSAQKLRNIDSKQKNEQLEDEGPRKKGELTKKIKTGTESSTKQKKSQVADHEIEDFSSELEDSDGSDADWIA